MSHIWGKAKEYVNNKATTASWWCVKKLRFHTKMVGKLLLGTRKS